MNKFVLLIIVFIFTLIICNAAVAADTDHTYTFDEDFDNGTFVGVEHNTTHDQLQLSNNTTNSSGIVQPFIWIPNSNEGTVSKVDTLTGNELARYRICPENVSSYANPSRTTVDLEGNCWVGNRQTGTAVKIGLYENGGYIDRNGNGIIETSRDLNGDGVISGDELLPWGQDECVFYEIILIPGSEGTYAPGEYKGPYANDYWDPGPRGLAVDSKNNVWIGTFGSMKYYYVSGITGQILKYIDISSTGHTPYGAVMDQNGILWSSGDTGNNILRLDPSNDSFIRINLRHVAYGLALDNNNHLFVSGLNNYRISRINVLTGEIEWTKSASYGQGIAVTPDGDIWTANNYLNTVSRFSNDGILKATISVGKTPTGVAVDREGKVWVVDVGDEYIHRIDPATNTIDISKRIPGGLHYGYSDMTGLIANTITTRRGTWTVIHDSELQNAPWGVISWNSSEPPGTSIKVRVRSSNDKQNWSDWEDASNGSHLSLTPPGRYLQVETTLQILSGNVSPILYDLRVMAPIVDIALTSHSNNLTPHPGDIVQFILEAKNNGPTDASGVKVSYNLPSGFEFISSPPAYNPSTRLWNIGNLASGASTSLIIQARSITPGMFISSAWAFSNEYDLNMANNLAFLSVRALAQSAPPYQPPTSPNEDPEPVTPNEDPEPIIKPMNDDSKTNINPVNAYQKTTWIQKSRAKNTTVPMQDTGVPLNLSGLAILIILFGNLTRRKRIMNNKFFWVLMAFCFIFIACGTVSAADNTTVCISNSANGSGSNRDSSGASISVDGNYIAFSSYADNLVPNDTNGHSDVFVYDVNSGKITRVSVSSNGSEPNYNSYQPSISADGRYIAFMSYATNLVEGSNDYYSNIFVHDRNTGATTRISVSPTGEDADGNSFAPSISADGRYIAFVSYAHNLVNDGSTREYYGTNIFVHDRISRITKNITVLNTDELYYYYGQPSISSDGRYIAFTSGISGPVACAVASSLDNNLNEFEDDPLPNYSKVLVYDRITGITENIGVSSTGEEANEDCSEPSISADGRYVTFSSYADNLVSGDNNQMIDIFVRDRLLGTTNRVSISSTGEEADYDSCSSSISSDGTHVAFVSWATNLVTGDNNDCADVFVRDLISGTTKRISVSYRGEEANDSSYGYSSYNPYSNSDYRPSLNNNGSLAIFSSYATNLVPFDNNGYTDVFLYGPVNNFYAVYGEINPNLLRSGDLAVVKAYTNSDTEIVVASILGNDYNLEKQSDGTWILNYIIPTIPDGLYDVLLTAKNTEGNQTTTMLHFTVDNTSPTVVGSVNPDFLNMYSRVITITASSDTDTESVTATILGGIFDMYKTDEHTWVLYYTVSNLSDGVYPIILTAKDAVGNQGTDSINFTVDTTPPTVTGTITPNLVKSGDSITITALSDPDTERIEIGIPGVGIGFLTKQSDGTWLYENYIVPGYNDGIHTVSLYAYDYAGNYGYASLEYEIDNAPWLFIIVPSAVKPGNLITLTAYSAIDAESVEVSILGETLYMIGRSEGYRILWSLNYTVPQVPDGSYPLLFTATDRRGNQETESDILNVDTVPPTVTGTITPNLVKSGNTIRIIAQSDNDVDHVDVTLCGETVTMRNWGLGTWSVDYTVPQVPDGVQTVLLTATDWAGNQGNPYSLNFTVDNTAPTINATIIPNKVKIGDVALINATSDPDTASISAKILGTSYQMTKQNDGTWSLNYRPTGKILEGTYPILFTATDQVGNTGIASINFEVDGIPNINATITPETVKNGQNIHINADTDPDVISLTAWIMGGTHNLVKQDDGSWNLDYTVPSVSDGPYSVILIAKDISGNQGNSFLSFKVDSSPVITGIINPKLVKSGDTIQISASTDTEVESLTARIFGDTLNLIKQADDTWSANYTVPSAFDGNYYVLLTATNINGNQGTAKVNFTVDNTPPVISVEILPSTVEPGEELEINVESSDDAESVTAVEGEEKKVLKRSNNTWTAKQTIPKERSPGTSTMDFETTDPVGNKRTTTASYDITKPNANPGNNPTNPGNNQGNIISPGNNQGGSSPNNGGSVGGSSPNQGTTGSNDGGSNTGNSGGLSPGGGGSKEKSGDLSPDEPNEQHEPDKQPKPNDDPSEQYKFNDFIGELLLLLKDILPILISLFSIFLFFALILIFTGNLLAGLYLIGICFIICLGLLLLYWAITKILEGLFKPRKPKE